MWKPTNFPNGIVAGGISIGDVNGNGTPVIEGATISGDIVGNVTGDVTGDLTGNVTGNVTGNLTGNVQAGTVMATTSLTVGASGTPLSEIRVYQASITPASVAANTTAEQTFTVNGLSTNDTVAIPNTGAPPTAGTGIVGARVSAGNTLALTFINATAAPVTPVAGTYRIIAFES